jgi:amino acid transporter
MSSEVPPDNRSEADRNRTPEPEQPEHPPQAPRPAPGQSQRAEHPPQPAPGRHIPHEEVEPDLERRDVLASRRSSRYVRIVRPHAREFVRREPGHLVATERATPARGPARAFLRQTKRLLIGTPLSTAAQEHERLNKVKALAVLSSDAISSVAYATEASTAVLITAGLAALSLNPILAACIATLMVIVGISYRQTIHAYPKGGGSYIVARDNLGDIAGLIAASALLIDYVLTVAVSVASGVAALASAAPPLGPYSVELGVTFIVLIALINLRGIREAGTIFAAPTYLFIASFLIMIGAGVVQAILHGGLLTAAPPQPPRGSWGPLTTLSIVLVLSAFAQGCSAMTGVEAISDGIPAFKRPESKNAARTLEWMIAILVTLFLGTTYLAWRFGLTPEPRGYPTLDSKIATHVFTGPFAWFFYVVQLATLLILVLAANTSFSDFPRLTFFLARDEFAPRLFRQRGDRLAYSFGIITLASLAIVLLVIFEGRVNALINLYALGVFTAFTFSQTGMVVRWLRLREQAGRHWRGALVANLVGAVATALVAGVVIFTKFDKGAWIVVLLIPVLVLTSLGIHQHYERARREIQPLTPLAADQVRHLMIIPIDGLSVPVLHALAYALSITPNVIAVHIATDDARAQRVRDQWKRWEARQRALPGTIAPRLRRHWATWSERAIREAGSALQQPPQLVVRESARGAIVRPFVEYVDTVCAEHPEETVTVVVPDFIADHWWQRVFRGQTALKIKLALLFKPGVVVTDVSCHLHDTPLAFDESPLIALVPIGELNRPAIQGLAYARSIASDYIAVHVVTDEDDTERLRADWDRWVAERKAAHEAAARRAGEYAASWGERHVDEAQSAARRLPQLVVIESPYRALISPLLAYIDALRMEHPEAILTVILPEFIPAHWWERLLHNQVALRLKWALLGRHGVVVTDIPYHLPR